jgi:hypothetical protein
MQINKKYRWKRFLKIGRRCERILLSIQNMLEK